MSGFGGGGGGGDRNKYVYEVTIPDLMPDRTYVVKVVAKNRYQFGDWSDEFRFVTSGKGIKTFIRRSLEPFIPTLLIGEHFVGDF